MTAEFGKKTFCARQIPTVSKENFKGKFQGKF